MEIDNYIINYNYIEQVFDVINYIDKTIVAKYELEIELNETLLRNHKMSKIDQQHICFSVGIKKALTVYKKSNVDLITDSLFIYKFTGSNLQFLKRYKFDESICINSNLIYLHKNNSSIWIFDNPDMIPKIIDMKNIIIDMPRWIYNYSIKKINNNLYIAYYIGKEDRTTAVFFDINGTVLYKCNISGSVDRLSNNYFCTTDINRGKYLYIYRVDSNNISLIQTIKIGLFCSIEISIDMKIILKSREEEDIPAIVYKFDERQSNYIIDSSTKSYLECYRLIEECGIKYEDIACVCLFFPSIKDNYVLKYREDLFSEFFKVIRSDSKNLFNIVFNYLFVSIY